MGIFRFFAVLFLVLVFLHPKSALGDIPTPEKKEFIVILVCSCGKPAFAMLATPTGVQVEGMPQTEKLIEACKGLRDTGRLIVMKTEAYTKESCPLSI